MQVCIQVNHRTATPMKNLANEMSPWGGKVTETKGYPIMATKPSGMPVFGHSSNVFVWSFFRFLLLLCTYCCALLLA